MTTKRASSADAVKIARTPGPPNVAVHAVAQTLVYNKYYQSDSTCSLAYSHYLLLRSAGIAVPSYHSEFSPNGSSRQPVLSMAYIPGVHAGSNNAGQIAAILADLHSAEPVKEWILRKAAQQTSQERALYRREYGPAASELPLSVYKDANYRNFVVSDRIYTLDYDTLTLAPAGYDLAKFFVSVGMHEGNVSNECMTRALRTYLNKTGAHLTKGVFRTLLNINIIRTRKYIGHGGYRYVPRPLTTLEGGIRWKS